MNSRLLRIALILVETTSMPLLLLGVVYLVTGYQMLTPGLEVFPRPRLIHTDRVLRIALLVLGFLHGYGGLTLLIARRIRRRRLQEALLVVTTIILVYILVFFLLVETMID